MRVFSVLLLIVLVSCGGGQGSGDVIVIGDQGPRDDYEGLEIADVNADGLNDLVVGHQFIDPNGPNPMNIAVFLQDDLAPGTFLPRQLHPYAVGGITPVEIQATDLQADGLPDLVVTTYSEGGFRVVLQDPAVPGVFPASVHYGPSDDPGSSWPGAAIGDIDGDLLPDIALIHGEDISYFPQDGANPGIFLGSLPIGGGMEDVFVGDVNDDGLNDVLTFVGQGDVPDTLVYSPQNPNAPGQFLARRSLPFEFSGHGVGLADFDGDGRTDIVVGGFDVNSNFDSFGTFAVFWQTDQDVFVRSQVYLPASNLFSSVVVPADLDGNGAAEIVVGNRAGAGSQYSIQIFTLGPGDIFRSSAILPVPADQAITLPQIKAVRIGDLNNDFLPDIALSTNEVFVWFQQAGGAFGTAVRVAGQ